MKARSWAWVTTRRLPIFAEGRAVLPPDFDRLEELFDLVKARDEYR